MQDVLITWLNSTRWLIIIASKIPRKWVGNGGAYHIEISASSSLANPRFGFSCTSACLSLDYITLATCGWVSNKLLHTKRWESVSHRKTVVRGHQTWHSSSNMFCSDNSQSSGMVRWSRLTPNTRLQCTIHCIHHQIYQPSVGRQGIVSLQQQQQLWFLWLFDWVYHKGGNGYGKGGKGSIEERYR